MANKPLAVKKNGTPIWGYNAKGQPICNAKIKNKDARCQNTIVMANGRCARPGHGGKSTGRPCGPKGSRYSRFLPQNLAARYEEVLSDPELISVKDQIAVLDSLLSEKLEGLADSNTHATLWSEASRAFADLKRAINERHPETIRKAISALGATLSNGLGRVRAEQSAREIIQEQAKLATVESKRLAQMEANITAKEAVQFITALMGIINEEITEHATRTRIAQKFESLMYQQHYHGVEEQP